MLQNRIIGNAIFKSEYIKEISNYRSGATSHFTSNVFPLQLNRVPDKIEVFDEHQSAYRKYNSTKTALLDITSTLLWGLDNKSTFMLIDTLQQLLTVSIFKNFSIVLKIGRIRQTVSEKVLAQ